VSKVIRCSNNKGLVYSKALKPHATSEVIFANPKTGKAYSPNAIRRHIKVACDQAEVPHFTPHQIRHLATVTGLEISGDADLVQRWIGWLTPEMIRTTYGHVGNRLDNLMTNLSERMREITQSMNRQPALAPSPNSNRGNVLSFFDHVSQKQASFHS
jgi:hypothetical protein